MSPNKICGRSEFHEFCDEFCENCAFNDSGLCSLYELEHEDDDDYEDDFDECETTEERSKQNE